MKIAAATIFSSQGEAPFQEDHVVSDEETGIMVIADGFGGPEGAEAAKSASSSIRDFLSKQSEDLESTLPFEIRRSSSLLTNVLYNAFAYSNMNLLRLNESKHVFRRGGASVVAGHLYQDRLTVGGAGSGSLWLGRGNEWIRLVEPHTIGRRDHPFGEGDGTKDLIPIGALGLDQDFHIRLREVEVQSGDWVVLHSSGFRPDVLDELKGLKSQGFDLKDTAEWAQQICKSIQFNYNASVYLGIIK